jgi:hypothetical protein
MTSIDTRAEIVVDRPISRESIRAVQEGVLVTCTAIHCEWQGLFPDATLAKTGAERHTQRERRSGRLHYGDPTYTIVRLLDEATAQTVDASKLGLSVEEQRYQTTNGGVREVEFPRTTGDVDALVQRGDRIQIPPARPRTVCQVSETRSSGLPTWTVVFVEPDVDLLSASKRDFFWQNELIARDGEIYSSFGPDPLAAPAFEVVGRDDHQADFSEFGGELDVA